MFNVIEHGEAVNNSLFALYESFFNHQSHLNEKSLVRALHQITLRKESCGPTDQEEC
jgi:hypothetical protein